MNRIINAARFITRKPGMILASLTLGLVVTAGMLLASAPSASASCTAQDAAPETNILYCGLTGSTANDDANQFKGYYASSTDGYERDIMLIVNAAYKATNGHAIDTNNNPLFSGSWQLGTSYNDGSIKVNGVVVGTGTQISSRCNGQGPQDSNPNGYCYPTSRYHQLIGDVYMRDATWFFDTGVSSKAALVHFDNNGNPDLAIWVQCGNLLIFKPVTPVKSLQCTQLTATPDSDNPLHYTLNATAAAQNTQVSSYTFRFGDGSPDAVVASNALSSQTTHTYTEDQVKQGFTVMVAVNGTDVPVASLPTASPQVCSHPVVGQLMCDALTSSAVYQNGAYVYTFTTTINNPQPLTVTYGMIYGDNGTTVDTQAENGSTMQVAIFQHSYTQLTDSKDYTAQFVLNGQVQTGSCQQVIHIPGLSTLACVQLTPSLADSTSNTSVTYNFTANTSDNSKVKSYTFNFNDGTSVTQASNTYTKVFNNIDVAEAHTFTTSVAIQAIDANTAVSQSDACKTSFTTTPKPNVLSHAGPTGIFGLVGSTSVAGTIFRYIVLRRKSSL